MCADVHHLVNNYIHPHVIHRNALDLTSKVTFALLPPLAIPSYASGKKGGQLINVQTKTKTSKPFDTISRAPWLHTRTTRAHRRMPTEADYRSH